MTNFKDFRGYSEGARIALIVHEIKRRRGQLIGVAIDNDNEKVDRYIKKIKELLPEVEIVKRYSSEFIIVLQLRLGKDETA